MPKKKQKIDEKVIMSHLPSLPDKFSYTVERFSPLVWRIWLNHHYPFDYACGKPVHTIHSFIKSDGTVVRPKNCDKISREKVCHLSEITDDMKYTVIKPKYTTLLSYYD